MFFSTLTLKYNPDTGDIDDQTFQNFAKDKQLLSVKEHFFLYGELPHITLCISWRQPEAGSKRQPRPSEEWRDLLKTPEQEELFDRLRQWRTKKTASQGVPAYTIMTNRQLAETAVQRPGSKAALGKLKGFGPARAEKYGKELLAVMGIK